MTNTHEGGCVCGAIATWRQAIRSASASAKNELTLS
jgi:hypothetical protein